MRKPLRGRGEVQGRVLILAGGGGHTGYAYALAQALHKKVPLSFLAPKRDILSERRLSKFGEVKFLIKPRGPTTPNHEFAARFARALVDSMGQVSRESSVVVSTGSNFCIPPAIMAWAKGIPIINVESSVRFSKASKTARILQPFSTITALQWEEQRRLLDGVVVGPLLPKPEVKPWKGDYILVTGGTYGHRLLFDVLAESNLRNVVLQTGRVDPAPYIKKQPEWKVVTLTERFCELLAGAKVVITHFGSTALEAVVYGKPVVLAPNPEWTRTARIEDAEYLARKVNAVLIFEIKLRTILNAIDKARKMKVPTLKDGAENIASMIIELTGCGTKSQ